MKQAQHNKGSIKQISRVNVDPFNIPSPVLLDPFINCLDWLDL